MLINKCLFWFTFLVLLLLFYLLLTPVDSKGRLKDLQITALILARGGSKGIPLKNMALVNNRTLISRTISVLREFSKFHSIWVSTDHESIAREARLSGARVHSRSLESATDEASSLLAVKEFTYHHPEIPAIALFQCTSPFLTLFPIEQAYSMMTNLGYDSVFSVTRSYKLRWQYNLDFSVSPLNFDHAHRPRRQDWEGELVENGMFYFFRTRLLKSHVLQGGQLGVVEIPQNRSLEIDSPLDLRIAQAMSPLLDTS
ncbi:hypothetical protein M8J77_003216 [Diaphorina citri]|nr:hypothetical protein M8J77_003216 [Diaphorina citri]